MTHHTILAEIAARYGVTVPATVTVQVIPSGVSGIPYEVEGFHWKQQRDVQRTINQRQFKFRRANDAAAKTAQPSAPSRAEIEAQEIGIIVRMHGQGATRLQVAQALGVSEKWAGKRALRLGLSWGRESPSADAKAERQAASTAALKAKAAARRVQAGALLNGGKTRAEVMAIMGCSKEYIGRVARSIGHIAPAAVKASPAPKPKPPKRPRVKIVPKATLTATPARGVRQAHLRADVIRLTEQGHGCKVIGDMMGITRAAVQRIRAAAGIIDRQPSELTDAILAEAAKGDPMRVIAIRLGCSKSTVSRTIALNRGKVAA